MHRSNFDETSRQNFTARSLSQFRPSIWVISVIFAAFSLLRVVVTSLQFKHYYVSTEVGEVCVAYLVIDPIIRQVVQLLHYRHFEHQHHDDWLRARAALALLLMDSIQVSAEGSPLNYHLLKQVG